MGQVSSVLRRLQGGYGHWCPACEEIHQLPDKWAFDGNLERPTFHPSFKHEGVQTVKVNGRWTGDWVRDANGNTVRYVCHYTLTAGQLNFHNDCTHSMANKAVPLPALPDFLQD